MKRYLVTGGAGFIGSNFIKYILNKYNEDIFVVNLDKLTYAGNLQNLKSINTKQYKFIKGDICDTNILNYIFEKYDIDYVVNFAAESHVDRSIKDPDVFMQTNVLGTHKLLEVCKNYWIDCTKIKSGKKYIQISTDEVYGSLGRTGCFTENTPINPHSPYSASKASGDLIVQAYHDTFKMPINITRCSNNYGPFQFPEKLIPLVINNCLNNNKIPIYGDGLNVRDWIYVKDHCRAIDLVVNEGKIGEVYNIGGKSEKTNIEIVETIIKILNEKGYQISKNLIKYVEDRKGHDKRYAIDDFKITEKLHFKRLFNFKEGMIETIDWYLENKKWLNEIVSGEYGDYYKKIYNKEV